MEPDYPWDERYKSGKEALPWDTGLAAPELVDFYGSLGADGPPAVALEIGCGTGTNAIWMAERGTKVTATDISPTAIESAIEKLSGKDLAVEFKVADICTDSPVTAGSCSFVFDRGVYHVMTPENRSLFVERVADALQPGGWWLCLAGCADEFRENKDEGPPQLTACELLDKIETKFEIHSLNRSFFLIPDGRKFLAWRAIFRLRA